MWLNVCIHAQGPRVKNVEFVNGGYGIKNPLLSQNQPQVFTDVFGKHTFRNLRWKGKLTHFVTLGVKEKNIHYHRYMLTFLINIYSFWK